MKKAFNFRSAIVCVLVLIMCLTAFVACDKDKDGQDDLSGLGKAKDYVKQLYINNNEETAADYTVVSKVNIAGTIYNVSWTVAITTEGADADSVKVVAGESNVTIDVIDMAESEIKYVLTATITDAKGNTETVSFNRKVPKFHVATWAEYAAAEDGKLLVVDGIVTMFTSKGNNDKNNTMYLQDADGAYYAYSMDEDPKDKNIAVGMKVRLTGTKKTYNGTYELEKVLIKEVLDTNVQEVAPININELLANATSVKDKKLTNLQGSIVTLTDAILVEVDDSQKYCYFTVGGIKTYIRPSASAGFLSSKEITAFMKAFKEKIGYTATITGQALVYNNAFYMQPISKDAVEYGAVANLTPAEQVKFVKDNANALSNVTYSGYTVTLPGASDIFTDVKIAWTVDNTEICKIENGVATFTYDDTKEGGKVKLTATYTHATDTTVAPLQNEYTLELLAPQEATVEKFLTKDEDGKVYIITGYIVADGSSSGSGSFVVADATGAVFSYNKADVALGDKVKVFGTRSSNSGVPQIGTLNVVKLDKAEGESYTYPTPEVIDGTTFDLSTLTKTSIADYTGKYTKVTGLTFYKDGTYNSAGLLKEGKTAGSTAKDDYTQVLSLYSASDAIPEDWAGKPVVVYGYVRGFSANKYLTIQVAKVEIGYDDATKVAQAKEALTEAKIGGTEFDKSFGLPTKGDWDTTITWAVKGESSVLAIEGNHATVTKPQTESETVTIVATIKSGEVTDTKEFVLTILGETPSYAVNWEGANITAVYGDDNTALAAGGEVKKGTVVKFTVVLPTNKLISSVTVNGEALANTAYVTTFSVTVSAVSNVVVNYVEYTPIKVADFIAKTKGNTLYAITGYIGASSATADEEGSFVVIDETGAAFSYNKVVGLALGDYVTVYGTRAENFSFPQVGTVHVEKLEGGTYVEPTAEEIAVADVKVDGTDLYIGKFYQIVGGTIAVDGNYINLMNGTTKVASLYTNTTDAETYKALAGKDVIVYGYSRGVNTKNSYWQVQVARMVEVNDAVKVAQAKAALTLDVTSTGANFTLPTTGINGTTISWTSSNTAVVSIEGGNATVNNTTITEDTVVTLTATIKLNETADTKTFDVTITKEIKNYTVTIVAPTEGGTLVVKANTEDVVSGASLTENTVLTFVAEPAKGYKLVAIKVNGVAVSETTLALTENVEVTAEFKLLPTSKVEGAEIKSFAELKALLDGGDTTNMYYTMGYIKTVSNATYGNATIEDFDGNTFEIYGMYDFTGATRYDSLATKPVAGDFVVLYGKLALFNTTYEMKDARIAQLNDTVYAPTFAARVEEAKNALTLEAEYGKNFDLVATGLNGTTITWISSNTGLVSIAETAVDGKYLATVTVPDVDTTVTLTATITLGTAQDTKEISVKIKANTKVALTYGTSENGTFEVKANGAVVESGAQLDAFTTVTVTVTPAEGYQLASYTLGEGEAVTTVAGQTSFTFDITATTTLSVAFDRVQSAVATLTFPDANSANNNTASSYTGTWAAKTSDGVEFTVTNFNNNKWGNGWTYIRCGSKKGASVASIATKAVMADVITKVVVTIDKVTASVVNSIKLVVASDAEFANIVETVDVDSIAAGEKTFNVSADKRAANLYYKLVVDCNKASSNGPVQISKIVFWA